MKIFFIIATVPFSLKAAADNFCRVYGKDPVANLQSRAEYGDITEYAEIAGQQCTDLSVEKLLTSERMSAAVWKSLRSQGYINQINYHASRAMSYAEYGKADSEDFDQLKKYAQLLDSLDQPQNKKTPGNGPKNLSEQNSFIKEIGKTNKVNQNKKTSCASQDYRNKLGPIRDQTNMDWCYAFVTADLLSLKTNQRISAASLSALYGKFMNGGHGTDARGRPSEIISKTVEFAKKNGACSEADFPSEFRNAGENYVENLRVFVRKKYSTEKSFKSASNSNKKGCQPANLISSSQRTNFESIRKIQDNVFTDQELQHLEQLACKNRIKLPAVTVEPVPNDGSPTSLIEKIDQLIDTKTPVGINYYSGFLKEPTATQINAHASIIAGRKLDPQTGKCEYLIRNSWGKDCSKMPGIDPEKCEGGYFWIPREELHRHVIDAVFIK